MKFYEQNIVAYFLRTIRRILRAANSRCSERLTIIGLLAT